MTATVEGWIDYAAARGDTVADDADSAAALVRGSDYVARFYLNRLTSSAPEQVVDEATYEAAKLELANPGFFSKTYTADQQKVLTKVGSIQWTVRGDASGAEAATPISTTIEAMFYPYMLERGKTPAFLMSIGRSPGL
ncbi:hypothetical protein [Salipiger sp. PrR003]|uniref:hypothetical protein n=1 Tax=Salipiger sp. PrR003 TaxID=2706776 RepID=UPI0013D8E741|nr:hypothetical protein [Salipiger sp. PrR003]NDV52114.1 hypothetical protein [Salipiger sp. PrR003]